AAREAREVEDDSPPAGVLAPATVGAREHVRVLGEILVESLATVLHDESRMLERQNLAEEAMPLIELLEEAIVLAGPQHDRPIAPAAQRDLLLSTRRYQPGDRVV